MNPLVLPVARALISIRLIEIGASGKGTISGQQTIKAFSSQPSTFSSMKIFHCEYRPNGKR